MSELFTGIYYGFSAPDFFPLIRVLLGFTFYVGIVFIIIACIICDKRKLKAKLLTAFLTPFVFVISLYMCIVVSTGIVMTYHGFPYKEWWEKYDNNEYYHLCKELKLGNGYTLADGNILKDGKAVIEEVEYVQVSDSIILGTCLDSTNEYDEYDDLFFTKYFSLNIRSGEIQYYKEMSEKEAAFPNIDIQLQYRDFYISEQIDSLANWQWILYINFAISILVTIWFVMFIAKRIQKAKQSTIKH